MLVQDTGQKQICGIFKFKDTALDKVIDLIAFWSCATYPHEFTQLRLCYKCSATGKYIIWFSCNNKNYKREEDFVHAIRRQLEKRFNAKCLAWEICVPLEHI